MISPLQQAIVMYTTELYSQMLVITFMNKTPVVSYGFSAFSKETSSPYESEGFITIEYNNETWITKMIFHRGSEGYGFELDVAIFNPRETSGTVLGIDGSNISRLRSERKRTIAIKFDSVDATETAKGIITWLYQIIGKIEKEGDDKTNGKK